jgi:hypothetical protein
LIVARVYPYGVDTVYIPANMTRAEKEYTEARIRDWPRDGDDSRYIVYRSATNQAAEMSQIDAMRLILDTLPDESPAVTAPPATVDLSGVISLDAWAHGITASHAEIVAAYGKALEMLSRYTPDTDRLVCWYLSPLREYGAQWVSDGGVWLNGGKDSGGSSFGFGVVWQDSEFSYHT